MERTVLLLSLTLSLALPARSQMPETMPGTASDLVALCREADTEALAGSAEPGLHGFCLGYVGGLFQANGIVTALGGRPLFCAPDGVTPGQVRQILLKTMDDYPEMLHEDAAKVMVASLAAAYPCVADRP